MTLAELERGMEQHEKRMASIQDNLRVLGERTRLGMELHEKRMARVEDNLIVQGELLNRVDQRLDRLASVVEKNSEEMRLMQAAMTSLFQRMDAFIRGLERRNGHEKSGSV